MEMDGKKPKLLTQLPIHSSVCRMCTSPIHASNPHLKGAAGLSSFLLVLHSFNVVADTCKRAHASANAPALSLAIIKRFFIESQVDFISTHAHTCRITAKLYISRALKTKQKYGHKCSPSALNFSSICVWNPDEKSFKDHTPSLQRRLGVASTVLVEEKFKTWIGF